MCSIQILNPLVGWGCIAFFKALFNLDFSSGVKRFTSFRILFLPICFLHSGLKLSKTLKRHQISSMLKNFLLSFLIFEFTVLGTILEAGVFRGSSFKGGVFIVGRKYSRAVITFRGKFANQLLWLPVLQITWAFYREVWFSFYSIVAPVFPWNVPGIKVPIVFGMNGTWPWSNLLWRSNAPSISFRQVPNYFGLFHLHSRYFKL